MKKEISLSLFMILLAIIEAKMRLWSGYAPNLLLLGGVGLAGSVPLLELLLYVFLGFLFLAGPVFSEEILVMIVIVSFAHFLRLFVFGPSVFLAPFLSVAALVVFYLESVGLVIFSNPLFLFEICLISLVFSFLPTLIVSNLRDKRI